MIEVKMPRDMKKGEVLELYDPHEARTRLEEGSKHSISMWTFNRLRKRGWVDHDLYYRVGRGWVYSQEAIDHCIKDKGWDREHINVEESYDERGDNDE